MNVIHLLVLAAAFALSVAAIGLLIHRIRGAGTPQATVEEVEGTEGFDGNEENAESARAEAEAVATAWRREPAARLAGVAWGLVVALLTSHVDVLGRGLLLAGPIAALTVVAAVTTGQVLLRPAAVPVRVASLRPRRVLDYVPRRLAVTVTAMTAYLLALLTATSLLASADDLGRAGRAIAYTGVDDAQQAACAGLHTPWPGSFYAVPILLVVLAGLAVALPSLRYVTLRPRLGTDDRAAADEALRRRAASVLLAAVGVLVTVPALAVEGGVAGALDGSGGSCPAPAWWSTAGLLAGLSALPTFALFAWCAVLLLAPSLAEPARPRFATRTAA